MAEIPESDKHRVDSVPPGTDQSAVAKPPPTVVLTLAHPAREGITDAAQPARYPFTKSTALINDGVAYGDVIVERFACYDGRRFIEKTDQYSIRTRTGRTFPSMAETKRDAR